MDKINSDIASIILSYAGYFQWGKFFDALYPGSRQQCYNMNICSENVYIRLFKYYKLEYRLFGKLHRENDKPAVEIDNGNFLWYYRDKLHRDEDKPAIEWSNGDKYWYMHGKHHRENDKPAAEWDGSKFWYYNDIRHRSNGQPAIIWSDGSKDWYIDGQFIRSEESI
jgi:hypothetical protein